MAKGKSLIQKAIDGVDHMIHPDQDHNTDELDLKSQDPSTETYSTSEVSNTPSLRKFDKFKSSTGEKQNDE